MKNLMNWGMNNFLVIVSEKVMFASSLTSNGRSIKMCMFVNL